MKVIAKGKRPIDSEADPGIYKGGRPLGYTIFSVYLDEKIGACPPTPHPSASESVAFSLI